MNKQLVSVVVLLFTSAVLFSCKKDPGVGGTSGIYGKVYVKDYNATFTVLQDEYYAPDVDVYIIYGDDKSYGDKVKTSYDGTYEFKYLRKGTYHVYAYSKDSTLQTTSDLAVIKKVEITKNHQDVEVPEIIIFK
ncbi:MAG: hypothetical protein NTU44_01345 [Bacteroidetes bacterium]|nr:hypothetical protein [Bacteroidota bacterium]